MLEPVGSEVVVAIEDSRSSRMVLRELNKTRIALIPKKEKQSS